ncbi:Dnaj protein [Globisporangium polare]
MAGKRASVAYLLWLVGFWMGLHHLYLGRPRAAFLHTVTLNVCGLGWWRDLLCIPSFVREANREREFVALKAVEQRFHRKPPVSWLVVWIQMALAQVFGAIASALIPRDAPELLYEVLFAIGAAWGIWFTGAALDEQVASSFKRVCAVIIGVVVVGYYAYAVDGEGVAEQSYKSAKGTAMLLGVIVFWYNRSWSYLLTDEDDSSTGIVEANQEETVKSNLATAAVVNKRPGWWRSLAVYYALLAAYTGALGTAVFFHGEITIIVDGEARTHSFPEAAENVLRSEELFQHFYDLFADILSAEAQYEQQYQEQFKQQTKEKKEKGSGYKFEHKWRRFQSKIDISGRKRYLKVLGLSDQSNPSQAEIKSAYKRLALRWHPDKYAGDDAVHAQKMFYKIQEAYERLQKLATSGSEKTSTQEDNKQYRHRDDEL